MNRNLFLILVLLMVQSVDITAQNKNANDIIRKEINKEAEGYLRQMSTLTAGRFYRKEARDLKKAFKAITEELRNQYRLGYYPQAVSEKGDLHKIKVKVNRKKVAVRARATYRAN